MEIDKQAKVVLAGGEALAHEIEVAIRDIVISNAAAIERFHERREELTKVNHQFLFFYAASLVLLFASDAERWTEEEINSVIDKAAEEIVREMRFRFRTAGQGDPEGERSTIATQLRGMFENVRSNFSHLGEIGEEKEISDRVFTLILLYLEKVHPASLTFLVEGNIAVLFALQQSFGLISITSPIEHWQSRLRLQPTLGAATPVHLMSISVRYRDIERPHCPDYVKRKN